MGENKISVFGFGNSLMDFIIHINDDIIQKLKVKKGTMNLIDQKQMNNILSLIKNFKYLPGIPGGSCANVLRGIAWLNKENKLAKPVFCGAVARDDLGKRYIESIQKFNVESNITRKQGETGVSLVLVTPDHERTMFTHLGACRSIRLEDVDFSLLKQAQILHFNGYMWDLENQIEIINRLTEFAKRNKILISFDLADPFVVKREQEKFLCWIPQYADIIFGNKEEFMLLIQEEHSPDAIMKKAKSLANIVIMKLGADGCCFSYKKEIEYIPGIKVGAVDTTGAGDSFAAGFLYHFLQGNAINISVKQANKIAANIVTVEGCNYSLLN